MNQLKRVLCAVALMLVAAGSVGANTPTKGQAGGSVDKQGNPVGMRVRTEAALQRLEAMDEVEETNTYEGDVLWVAEYIRRWAATNPDYLPNKIVVERASVLARIIVDVSREMDVDYRVATVICRMESGFQEGGIKGFKDGRDHGLMQVNGGTGVTSEDQIREGLTVWTDCRRGCGGLEATLTCYAIGKCAYPTEQGTLSLKAWQGMAFKQRGTVYRMKLFERSGLTKNRRFASIIPTPVPRTP
jgi:hypothetical protein